MDLGKLKAKWFKHNTKGKYEFINRKKDLERVCFVLIGYKQFLWDDVLGRLIKYLPDNVEVCLLSSGKHLKELEDIAEKNNWSYVSIKRNNVCLAQNIAISLFPKAKLIYKIDEDIYLTEGAFEKMEEAMNRVDSQSEYISGIAAPILNINAYGYYRLLEKTALLSDFEARFGKAKMVSGQKSLIESNPDVAKYMWGIDSPMKNIDELNREFAKSSDYSICPIRLSIGCMLLKRSFWELFGGFPVVPGDGMGLDETLLIGATSAFSHVTAVAENSVVGHFGYGGEQGKAMKAEYAKDHKYFEEH